MALSQFETAVLVQAEVEVGRGQVPAITVGGPLRLDPANQYGPKVGVHFVIIQSAEGADEHDPLKARRVRGYVEVGSDQAKTPAGVWEATVARGQLVAGKPARGVGVAVIEYLKPYAYESYTWCDFIPALSDQPGQVQQSGP